MNTSLTVAMLFGQFSEECGAGLEMIENDNFTASQLLSLWPRHFTRHNGRPLRPQPAHDL